MTILPFALGPAVAAFYTGQGASSSESGAPIDQGADIVGNFIAAPCDVVVGADQGEIAFIELTRLLARYLDDIERNSALACGGLEPRCIGTAGKLEQREIAPEAIIQGLPLADPKMRCARPGPRLRDVAIRIVGGRAPGSVITIGEPP
jgi:hypothetical protein